MMIDFRSEATLNAIRSFRMTDLNRAFTHPAYPRLQVEHQGTRGLKDERIGDDHYQKNSYRHRFCGLVTWLDAGT
jgi:hypothetical protein